jgi:wyosine [tRNA(Phe)-imidazoG37] synthetase (radical SAM superfamily)
LSYIYGPVPSRRLGISLGIDVVPTSTCTFDCVYCQLGKTLHKVSHWKGLKFPNTDEIIENLKINLKKYDNLNYITISGGGEPTLNPHLGEIAEEIRSFTKVLLALITNSSLLIHDTVIANAKKFDIVMPSLDAGDNKTFKKINRPAKGFNIDEIADAITRLREVSKGKIWLEVMLIKGKINNTTSESIANITTKVNEIFPDKIFLNTPIRPPCESWVKTLTDDELKKIKLKMEAEIPKQVDIEIVPKLAKSKYQILNKTDVLNEILQLLIVRPCTLQDISNITGMNISEVGKYIGRLLEAGRISKRVSNNETYYLIIGGGKK